MFLFVSVHPINSVFLPDSSLDPSYCLSWTSISHTMLFVPNQHPTAHQYHQHGHTYIGSTSISIPKREYNRHAKLKQLQNNHPISAELSLRYWHSKQNLHDYSTIYLPFPPRHLRSSMDLRTPPHPRLATHTQLAIHPTSPQTQSIRMAICKTPYYLHSHVHPQTPFPTIETPTKHHQTTQPTHQPTPTCPDGSPRT